MSVYVPFNGGKRKIRYSNKTANTIVKLFLFFKNNTSWVSSSTIRQEIKISNNLLWQLAYQGYLKASCRRYFVQSLGQSVQFFFWKANLKKFEDFQKITNISIQEQIKKEEQKKKMQSVSLIDILQTPDKIDEDEED